MTDQLQPMPDDWRRALAIVAHPDDLEYGCASAVAVWTDGGRDVTYLMVTRGEAGIDTLEPAKAGPLREREERASAAVAGVTQVEFLDHADGVIEYGVALRRDLAAAVRRHRPELVITLNFDETWGGTYWNTPDHRAVGRAVMDAVGDAGNRWIFPEIAAEPWNGVRWIAVMGTDAPTHAVDVTTGLERGVRSLLEHRAYIEALTDTDPETYARDLIEGYTREQAGRFAGRPAVTFRLYPR
ncbi:PIG-L family deacetylase [Nonomuraea sp. MG754425]|uniref:PIG-L deacetylase family protein n=1 Tax=Nonomuraea sp. MG754425 TaxID=2570319 RepID=UPI001F35E5BA|nr:PIG-L deacetylase family protein [Nonomuraea sp. MG754425]MCF6471169.1 PIG-L family deacetylase [Nonomuraea sp. MG754425]